MVGGSRYSLAEKKNEKLEKLADDAIDVIVQAQQEDGYLDTYFIIKEPGRDGEISVRDTSCIQQDI